MAVAPSDDDDDDDDYKIRDFTNETKESNSQALFD
jgi:hypothetical protein